jgi:hypothetical protein
MQEYGKRVVGHLSEHLLQCCWILIDGRGNERECRYGPITADEPGRPCSRATF